MSPCTLPGAAPPAAGGDAALPAEHLALSTPATHPCGVAFRGPPRRAAICTVHPSRTFGCLCVSGPRGGGHSWHLPLPSAVPGPEHGARRVLSDAALSASWCPAPRGPHASAFPSAVAPWASGRRFHLLPLSPLGGSSSGSRSEELPASAPSESTRCRRRRRSGLPPRVFLPGVPGVGSACGVSAPAGPCRSLSGRRVSPWPCFLHPGKRLLHYPESPTLPCPHVGGGWSLRIPWG